MTDTKLSDVSDVSDDGAGDSQVVDSLDSEMAALRARARFHSRLRIGFFVAFVAGFFILEGAWGFLFISLPAALLFVVTLARHARINVLEQRLGSRLQLLNESAARRQNRRFDHAPPAIPENPLPVEEGLAVYSPEPESFALDRGVVDDLQLVEGRHTLFGLLDVSSSVLGAWRLFRMLTRPLARVEAIRSRQRAVGELADREGLATSLLETLFPLRAHSFATVPRSLEADTVYVGRPAFLALVNLVGTAPLVLAILAAFWLPAITLLVLSLTFNFALVSTQASKSNVVRDRALLFGQLLRVKIALAEKLRGSGLQTPEWRGLIAAFDACGSAARSLVRYQGLLQFHGYGIVSEIFNVFSLWELRLVPLAESAIARHRVDIERALGALAETEALLSLALPLKEQSGYTLPEPSESESPFIEAEGLGHPLLHSERVIRNDLKLGGDEQLWIVTGSNMAGKSTYLKSVGTNVLLAGAGGPVSATRFRWTPVRIYTDINIRDSLDDGKSYFRVEVERVLEVLRAASKSSAVLGIFNELFRGTNSAERLAMSRAILRELRSSGSLAIVATHDLALCELVTREKEPGMANYHFRERVEDGRMDFDYRLGEGPAPTRNAIRVLESLGYPERVTRSAREELGREAEGEVGEVTEEDLNAEFAEAQLSGPIRSVGMPCAYFYAGIPPTCLESCFGSET